MRSAVAAYTTAQAVKQVGENCDGKAGDAGLGAGRAMSVQPPPQRRRRWLIGAGALALGGAAVGGAAYLLQPPPEVLVAGLAPLGRDYQVVASFFVGRGTLRMARTAGAEPAGRSTEIWAIAPGAPPVSLGLVPAQASWRIALPNDLLPRASELTIALSDEGPGGADGTPTQPFLAAAPLSPR
ncbi:MAG: anti-sigma factor [Pseudomonadota bacterium]